MAPQQVTEEGPGGKAPAGRHADKFLNSAAASLPAWQEAARGDAAAHAPGSADGRRSSELLGGRGLTLPPKQVPGQRDGGFLKQVVDECFCTGKLEIYVKKIKLFPI